MITAREIAATFGGGTILPSGDVLVSAPGHSRKDRSLSIRPLPDGRVLVNSFSPRDDRLTLLRHVEDRLGISRQRPTRARVAQVFAKPPPPATTFNPLPLWNACL